MNDGIAPFLRGPLSDRHGGTAALRVAAEEAWLCDSRGLADEREPSAVQSARSFTLPPTPSLFSYQAEVVAQLDEWCKQMGSSRAALVSLPTGAGKTRTALWWIRRLIGKQAVRRVLWVAPGAELVEQAADALEQLWAHSDSDVPLHVDVGNFDPSGLSRNRAEIALVTAQLLARRTQNPNLKDTQLLVFDEAHQAVARTFQKIIETVLETPGCRVIGLTATPGRPDDWESSDLWALFGKRMITATELGVSPVEELVRRGVLAQPRFQRLELPKHWDDVRVRSKSASALPIDQLAAVPVRFWAVVELLKTMKTRERVLVFCASIAHCYALLAALKGAGLAAEVVTYRTDPRVRSKIISRFRNGQTTILLNKSILTTGFDCPAVGDVVLATPVRSSILWEQMVGRAMRGPAVGGSPECRVWELDDHRGMHRALLSYARFSDS